MTDLADQPARDRVESDTTATLFVEAGAGTGKTYALVRRLSTLLLDDEVPIDQIAAITFTEKAAAELRDRLRVHLVDRRDKGCVRADAALAVRGASAAQIGAAAFRAGLELHALEQVDANLEDTFLGMVRGDYVGTIPEVAA